MSLTQHLITSDEAGFKRATQSPFLASAARGDLSKDILGHWLANDRLYIHAYIKGTGNLLGFLQLPLSTSSPDHNAVQIRDWAIDALVNVRREENFFVDTATRYGINVNLPSDGAGNISETGKVDGLLRFESLFEQVGPSNNIILPWLEAAVLFYGTEKCYLDAWSWAKSQQESGGDGSKDADGGALRKEFIPNWSSPEFKAFVDQLGDIIDKAFEEEIKLHGEGVRTKLTERAEAKWQQLLAAEEAFWPVLQAS